MLKVAVVLRILLGLAYVVFGANHFLHFMPQPEGAPQPAADFGLALAATGYMWPLVGATQLVGGLLLWAPRTVPLGLIVLMPVTVNIVLFHAMLDPALGHAAAGYALAGIHVILLLVYANTFSALFNARLRA